MDFKSMAWYSVIGVGEQKLPFTNQVYVEHLFVEAASEEEALGKFQAKFFALHQGVPLTTAKAFIIPPKVNNHEPENSY